MYTDRIDPSANTPSVHRPLPRVPRRVPAGRASFGAIAFPFRRAIRRADETIVVEMSPELGPGTLLDLFEAAAQHGAGQLCLGTTLCRARPIDWEPATHAIVFELQRAASAEPRRASLA